MIFIPTPLEGAYALELQKLEDERGFFARTFCQREFEEHGLHFGAAQENLSYNKFQGTLRGMHFQTFPHQEARLVSCIQGAIHDVIIDLRPHSPTYAQHFSITLTAGKNNAIYVPEGFAHGFLTLEPDTSVHYLMSEFYAPSYARGVRWNDPAFGIEWPAKIEVISERDAGYPDYIMELLS